MNAKQLAELVLKVWGVLLVLGTLVSLPAALWMVWTVPAGDAQAAFMRASQIGYALNITVQAIAGAVVVMWAARIVALFESDVTPLDIDVNNAQLRILAFAIVGVAVLIDGLQNVAAAGYALLTKPGEIDTWSYMRAQQGESMIKSVVQIAAGALLILGRKPLVRAWSRLRSQPTSDLADSEDAG